MLGIKVEEKRIDTTAISDVVNVVFRFRNLAYNNNMKFIVSDNIKTKAEQENTAKL